MTDDDVLWLEASPLTKRLTTDFLYMVEKLGPGHEDQIVNLLWIAYQDLA